MKSESFFKGTIILISANAVSKILGAVLKIPLTYILGEEGMAIYQTSFSVYIMLLSFITSGLPFAISKYISEERALKRYGNIRFSIKLSVLLMTLLGLLGSLVMYFGADFFALSMKDPKAVFAIKAISPAIFFVATGCVFKSCYQGYACQTPGAVSQVIEAFVKLICGYLFALWCSELAVKYTAGAAIFGVTIGEAVATAVLMLFYIPYHKSLFGKKRELTGRKIAKSLISVAVPMTAYSMVSGLLGLLDASLIRFSLTSIIFSENTANGFIRTYSEYTHLFDFLLSEKKLSIDGARWLYGAYSGYAATVFNLPSGILASFGIAVLPIVSAGIVSGNSEKLVSVTTAAAKTILIISLPTSAVLAFFSKPILYILFKNTASHLMLSLMAPILAFSALSQFFSAVLNASGNIASPFRYVTLCNLLKIALTFFLVRVSYLNILGAILAAFIANILYLVLILKKVKKHFGIIPVSAKDFAKVVFGTALTVLISYLSLNPLTHLFKNIYVGFFGAMLLGFSGYMLSLILVRAIKKEEITRFIG